MKGVETALKPLRVEKVDEAITKVCGVFDELELTNEEIRHVARSVYEATQQQEEKPINKIKCWTTAASITAIIFSIISIILQCIS